MKTRAIILAGGEGTRLSILTAKRTKPAVPFGGKYRIIDFALSNCINSNLFDIIIIAQYRPHSLIEHIGAGGPWDLDREISGGVKLFTPYQAQASGWFRGTADAIQQNFAFIKRGNPDYLLILSGDHIYNMNYEEMIEFHQASQADVTIATVEVPIEEASRYGIISIDEQQRIISFVEKPEKPQSNLINMGVYIFKREIIDSILWEDHLKPDSSHDFGKDIIPDMIRRNFRVIAFPYHGYWVDVGTVQSYWKAHMDLLQPNPKFNLFSPEWRVITREEIQPPCFIHENAQVEHSLICNGCVIYPGAKVIHSVLSPGVHVHSGAEIDQSVILNDSVIGENVKINRSILDKHVKIHENAIIGQCINQNDENAITLIGKNSIVAANMILEAGSVVYTDIVPADYSSTIVHANERIQTKRLPNEL
ncbi:MAG: glucose-1-phosphate adenylyltransferase [Chloroflexi bacterium]|nr:glucose-1-phosphate adenylyltransferase [Chloroflexota bacterium]